MSFSSQPFSAVPFSGKPPAAVGGLSFSISPNIGHATGTISITATGVGTTWSGSNPFSVTGGTGSASISGYSNSGVTSATFNLVITALGTIVIADSNSGTTQTYDGRAIAPGAPTIGTLTDNHDGTISITFSAPADNGGASISNYTATSTSGGHSNTGASSPIIIASVNKGISQTVSVTATNSAGTGSASSASNAVTPVTVPGVPTGATASIAGSTSATVTFSTPSDNGGAAITGYTVTSSPAGGTDSNAGSTGLTHTVIGLTTGVAYTFTVTASNSFGTSAASSPSNSITPTNTLHIMARAPYLTTDTIGTKTYQIYTVVAGVLTALGGAVTTGFSAIPHITNGWWVDISVTPNGAFGDFYGIAVFSNINGSVKAAVELYSPPTSTPTSLLIDKIAPFLASDTITTPGYQLYDIDANAIGSHVTSGILAISGVTNGYMTQLTITPDVNGGKQLGVLWDGG